MATRRNSRKSRTNGLARLGKPNGIIQPRVQKVGPQRFGIVAIDCAKARSKWMLCDFYGKVLVPPTEVEHARSQMQLATIQFKEACDKHHIRDAIVAVEMTGTYHRHFDGRQRGHPLEDLGVARASLPNHPNWLLTPFPSADAED